ncbi:MAG: hypothetical protein U5Q44_12770 [Dehalococcoidia bacterium]|nr:hypothetical protein [Dehalococcoidia bacterium]
MNLDRVEVDVDGWQFVGNGNVEPGEFGGAVEAFLAVEGAEGGAFAVPDLEDAHGRGVALALGVGTRRSRPRGRRGRR